MNSRTNDSLTIDSLGSYSQPSAGSSAALGHTAPAGRPTVKVPRRLNDQVQFSQECAGHDDESASSLCSNFMAAWG